MSKYVIQIQRDGTSAQGRSPTDVFDVACLPMGRISELPAHMQRVVEELVELSDKGAKLEAFVGSETFQSLLGVDRQDLAEQLEHMANYAVVLRRRIERSLAA